MSTIAIIPARGGSKRIPKKNIKDFLGKPIIEYSITTALKSGLFDRVIVSTDSEEIAEIAKAAGAKVPHLRSAKNSDDYATTADVLNEVYQQLNQNFVLACCLYPTAPFVSGQSLKQGYNLLTDKNFDTVFSAAAFDYPIWRSLKLENEKAILNWPEHLNSRSQDLPEAFHDAGQFYWYYPEKLLQTNSLFTDNSGVVVLPKEEVQDIDTLSDWKIAELKYQLLNRNT